MRRFQAPTSPKTDGAPTRRDEVNLDLRCRWRHLPGSAHPPARFPVRSSSMVMVSPHTERHRALVKPSASGFAKDSRTGAPGLREGHKPSPREGRDRAELTSRFARVKVRGRCISTGRHENALRDFVASPPLELFRGAAQGLGRPRPANRGGFQGAQATGAFIEEWTRARSPGMVTPSRSERGHRRGSEGHTRHHAQASLRPTTPSVHKTRQQGELSAGISSPRRARPLWVQLAASLAGPAPPWGSAVESRRLRICYLPRSRRFRYGRSVATPLEVPNVTGDPTPLGDAAATRCHLAPCQTVPTHTAILCVALSQREHVSRIALPVKVCRDHRETFTDRFFTAARRASIEASLRAHGRESPDWSRTHLEFVALPRRPGAQAVRI